jgi:hypothetical protein
MNNGLDHFISTLAFVETSVFETREQVADGENRDQKRDKNGRSSNEVPGVLTHVRSSSTDCANMRRFSGLIRLRLLHKPG